MSFPPILILVILWLIMGLASSKKKKAQQQAQRSAKPGGKASRAEPKEPAPAKPQASPTRPTVMKPTITVTEHDDSIYQGSLNAETGEGIVTTVGSAETHNSSLPFPPWNGNPCPPPRRKPPASSWAGPGTTSYAALS